MQPFRPLRPLFHAFRQSALAAPLLFTLAFAPPALAAPEPPPEPHKAAPSSARATEHENPRDSARSKRRVARRHADTGRGTGKPAAEARELDKRRPAKKDDDKAGKSKAPLSIGAPNQGRLAGAVRLRSSRHLKTRDGARTWGLPVLVKALRRASFTVAKKRGDSVLLVGDLSARTGGSLDGHNSHQSGRDADVGFYVTNSKGKPLRLPRFVPFDASGNAIGVAGARFDDARNWALVEALLTDKKADVRYFIVAAPLRARLLAHAAKKRAPQELIAQAAAAMMSPRGGDLHNDHFHVRIGCPSSMRGTCVEEPSAREGATCDSKETTTPPGATHDDPSGEEEAAPAKDDAEHDTPEAHEPGAHGEKDATAPAGETASR
jgi:penicillin-insensitive murein DD-endopeptidase